MPPSQAAEQLNGNPPPSPRSPLFGFGEPTTPGGLLSSPHPSPESPSLATGEELLEELEQASADDFSAESHESPDAITSPGSTRVGNPLAGEGLRDMARAGVLIAGDQAHNFLARTEAQKAVELYKTDEEDAAGIGDPLARIAGRYQGIGEVSEDTADMLAAMLALARYGTKQIVRQRTATQLEAQAPDRAAEGPVDL